MLDCTTDVVDEGNGNFSGTDTVASGDIDLYLQDFQNIEALALLGSEALNLTGHIFNDSLYGNSGENALYGNEGNDSLVGGGGNDTLVGGLGDDIHEGGAGDDVYDVDTMGDVVTEDVSGGYDTVGSVSLDLDASRYANVEVLMAMGGQDHVLTGGGDVVKLIGDTGRDTLNGGGADETLQGGDGDDTLFGGAGADVFVFGTQTAGARDEIGDFAVGVDKIDLSGLGLAAVDLLGVGFAGGAGSAYVEGSSSNSLIRIDWNGDTVLDQTIVLLGVASGDLQAGDFI